MYLVLYLPPPTQTNTTISQSDQVTALVIVAAVVIAVIAGVTFVIYDPLDRIQLFSFNRRQQEVDVLKQIANKEKTGLSLYQIIVASNLPVRRAKEIIKRLESQDLIQTDFDLDSGRIIYKIK